MRVFSFWVAQGFEWVQTVDVWERVHAAAGVSQGRSWAPIPVELVQTDDDGSSCTPADAPYFPEMLAFREPAWERVREHVQDQGEVLPVDCPQAPLVVVNPLHVVDALDEGRSRLSRFRDGRVMRIKDWAFHPERVPAEGIFRIPQDRGRVLCTESTAHHLQALKLAGMRLEPLWSATPGEDFTTSSWS